jgi:glycosyltransferase involved in cell wall biosynthesis
MFIHELPMGGAEMVVSHLLGGVDRSKYDVRLVVVENARFEVPIPSDQQIERLPTGRFRRAIFRLTPFLRRVRPDVLIAHLSIAGVWAILACRLASRQTRVVVVEHNMPSIQYAHGGALQRLRILFLMRRTYRHADALVSISRAAAKDLEQVIGLPSHAVRVIENPTISASFESRAAEAPEHPWLRDPGLDVVLSVGRLAPQKDHELLIRGFALVAPERPNLRLVILGEGPLRQPLERLVSELGIDDRVDLAGLTANPYPAMRCSAAFAMSSAYEGAPLSVIEAVACGARVVATDVGFLAEFLDPEAGDVIVRARTPEVFAAGIREVLAPVPARISPDDRIAPYRVSSAVAAYERLIDELLATRAWPGSDPATGTRIG